MRRTRLVLVLYSLMISTLATLFVLGIVLRPSAGWTPLLKQEWAAWFGPKTLVMASLAAPTPNEPRYQIKASFDPQQDVIRGQQTVTLPQLRLPDIPFYLYSISDTPIQVRDVTLNGQPATFSLTAKQLTIHAPKSDSPQTVAFSFETKLNNTPKRTGTWEGVSTISYWYPILAVERDGKWAPRPNSIGFGDPFLMDLGDYNIEWNAPANIKWYASGEQTGASQANGRATTTWSAENVRNFALVGGTGFQEVDFDTGTGTKVIVATLNKDRLGRTAALARSAVETYSSLIGHDPYPVLNVLELPPKTIYAHELPNMALFSQDLWSYPDYEHWIAHEVAHAWFYNSVGNYEAETPWLDEGLADYLALLETQSRVGNSAYIQAIQADWNLFQHNDTYSPYPPGTPAGVTNGETAMPYGTYHTSEAHYYYTYLRPILMYHDLRKQLGDDTFFKFLRQYYIKNTEKTATRADLEQALEDVAPQALPLLKLWLDTPNDQLLPQVRGHFGG